MLIIPLKINRAIWKNNAENNHMASNGHTNIHSSNSSCSLIEIINYLGGSKTTSSKAYKNTSQLSAQYVYYKRYLHHKHYCCISCSLFSLLIKLRSIDIVASHLHIFTKLFTSPPSLSPLTPCKSLHEVVDTFMRIRDKKIIG